VSSSGGTLWFGSANCTKPALLATPSRGGNVELLVRVQLDRRGVERIERDLQLMFVDREGVLDSARKPRIPVPRGAILGGYTATWGKAPRLVFAVIAASVTRTVIIARSPKRGSAIELRIPPNAETVTLDPSTTARLLDASHTPAVLWERVRDGAIAFPVSVACAPQGDDAVNALEDVLDELAGRIPPAIATRSTGAGPNQGLDDGDESSIAAEDDAELELLTRTQHQGKLDRLAVRVELLRKRLSLGALRSDAARAHYTRVVQGLPDVPEHQRRILVAHLGGEV
jgi:hypothetical protein